MKELSYSQKYYQEHKEKINETTRKWCQNNKEKHQAYVREYIKNHREYYKKYGNNSNKRVRTRLMNLLGARCNHCGLEDMRILQVDHINGGGLKELKHFKGTNQMYKYYVKNPTIALQKLQLLCPNCNWLKRIDNNETRK